MNVEKVKKKFALNNSYFKNRLPGSPKTPFEVLEYYMQHKELPYTNGEKTDNWFYECFIEYQKRAGVRNSQFFTPASTAKEIAYMAKFYCDNGERILEPCSGFGMITKELLLEGFNVNAFDNDREMIKTLDFLLENQILKDKSLYTDVLDFTDESHFRVVNGGDYQLVVSNPPYELKELILFFEFLKEIKFETAILLLPFGFLDKSRPANLVKLLNDYAIKERRVMSENFAHTKIKAEIVVLQKIY